MSDQPLDARTQRKALLVTLLRFASLAAIAYWLGGFSFYGSVAIPAGVKVLGSHREAGYITQEVTRGLNVAGCIALAILGSHAWIADWRTRLRRRWAIGTWWVLTAIEAVLIALHPVLDRSLAGGDAMHERFLLEHRAYLWLSTSQWAAGVVHLWLFSTNERSAIVGYSPPTTL